LYTTAQPSTAQEKAKKRAFTGIGGRLSRDMQANLKAPIEIYEVEDALKSMASNKALGSKTFEKLLSFTKTFEN
jgi:hypothetical protein